MFVCPHVCCVVPNDPNHQHLFEPSECLDCKLKEERSERRQNR